MGQFSYNPLNGNLDFSSNGLEAGTLEFMGNISVASDFPTPAQVQENDIYRVLADVTDNDGTKTNTGQSFVEGDEIMWDGVAWEILGNYVSLLGTNNTWTGTNEFGRISASSLTFTGAGVNVVATNTADGSDNKAITIAGGGAYGITRGSGVAVIGNEYASTGGDLELMAGDSAISGAIKFYVGNGAGGALLAGSIARSTMLTTFNGSVVANSTLSVASTLTVGGQATFSGTLTLTATKQLVSSASIYNYVDVSNASGNLVLSSRGSVFLDVDADNNSTSNVLYVRFNSATYTGIFEEDGALTLGPTLKNGSGALYCGGIAVMNNGNVTITNTNESTTLTNFTQSIANSGFIINTEYTNNAYTPGLFWATSNDNATKPKAGIFMRTTGSGANIIFGMSNSYATGITNSIVFSESGGIETAGKIQIGSTAPTASAGSALTINSSVTTGSAGSGSLIIQGANNTERIKIYSAGASGGGPLINLFSFRGSIASPTATQSGDIIGGLSGGGYGATGYSGNCYGILQYASENWTDSAQGTYTLMQTTGNGTVSPTGRLLINHDGAVTLGSSFGTGTGALYAGTGSFAGLLTTVASASGGAGFRVPHGAAPSSPTNGDMWTTTAGAFIRINGVTKSFTLV